MTRPSDDELQALLDAATPGEWRAEIAKDQGGIRFIYAGSPDGLYCVARMMSFTGGPNSDSANAALTALAPALAAEVLALRKRDAAAQALAEAAYSASDRLVDAGMGTGKSNMALSAALDAWEAAQ